MARKTDIVTISLEPKLLEQGKKNAKRTKRNFSNYIACLIERDAEALRAEAAKMKVQTR